MSTKSMELESFNARTITFEQIDQEICSLAIPEEKELLPAEPLESLDRLLLIYDAVRSLLLLMSAFRLFPPEWRAALRRFTQALDSVASARAAKPTISTKDFKAGKDL